MMSPIGGAVGPLMMGYVADASTMSLSFVVPLFGFVVVWLYATYAVRLYRQEDYFATAFTASPS